MSLELNPEDINRFVAEAIIKSALGEAVKKAVDKEIASLSQSYNNPIEQVVRNEVAIIIRDVLRAEHLERLKQKLTEALSAKLSDEFIDRVCDQAASKYS